MQQQQEQLFKTNENYDADSAAVTNFMQPCPLKQIVFHKTANITTTNYQTASFNGGSNGTL